MRPTTAKKLRRDERRRTCYCYLVPGCSSPARASHQNFQTLLPSEPPIRVPTPSLSREPIRARCSERLPSGSQSAQARALKRHRSRARRRPSCLQDATLFNPTDKSRTCDSSSQLARCRSRSVRTFQISLCVTQIERIPTLLPCKQDCLHHPSQHKL